jgi:hypothetical protein
MRNWMKVGTVCAVAACGGDDLDKPEFSQRQATDAECISGGDVLLVDGQPEAVFCNELTTETVSANLPQLVQETVWCTAETQDPAQAYRHITYKHARLFDGSLFVSVSCDTPNDQDGAADLFSADQAGASSGVMECVLLNEINAVSVITFTPNFLTRRLVVTENGVVATDQSFDADCTVVAAP